MHFNPRVFKGNVKWHFFKYGAKWQKLQIGNSRQFHFCLIVVKFLYWIFDLIYFMLNKL